MKIDGVSLSRQCKATGVHPWTFLGHLTSAHVEPVWVDCEGFIQATIGPDCVELMSSYVGAKEAIAIHDTDRADTVMFRDEKFSCLHIANHALFELAYDLSPFYSGRF